MLISLLFKEIQLLMEEQTIMFVQITFVLRQTKKRFFSASLKHLADTFTSEILATLKLLQFVRFKFIPYLVSFLLTTALQSL